MPGFPLDSGSDAQTSACTQHRLPGRTPELLIGRSDVGPEDLCSNKFPVDVDSAGLGITL